MSFERPYEGIKIVDMSQGIAGPYCAMLLAQHGAEVIKVEPHQGDWSRMLGTPTNDHTEFSFVANMGKRSLAIDLKSRGAPKSSMPWWRKRMFFLKASVRALLIVWVLVTSV